MQGSSLKADSLPAGSQAKEERIWVAWGMRGGGGGVCGRGSWEQGKGHRNKTSVIR